MFALRIVLALALVCLTVSGSPLDIYNKLGKCFRSKANFFKDFFPYRIPQFPVSGKDFSGAYTNVELSGLENVNINAKQISKVTDTVAVIEFDNTFPDIKIKGNLKGNIASTSYEGPVTGSVNGLNLKGKVSYANKKVTDLELTVTVKAVSIQFTGQKTPFTPVQTTQYFQNYFANNKNDLEKKSIELINNRINSEQKLTNLRKDCSI